MNCCDAYGNCNQGRDCPARNADEALVARIRASYPAPVVEENESVKDALFLIGGAACIAALCICFLIFGGK